MSEKIIFEEKFNQSNYKPIRYKGKKVQISDTFELKYEKQELRVVLESTNSKYIQGFRCLTNGNFVIDDKKFENDIYFREDTVSRKNFNIVATSKEKKITLQNIWISKLHGGIESIQYGHNGAAMIAEDLPDGKGKRYRCNDGEPDDDFDDLVFRIEYID